jgi:hypothetical protein
MSTLQRELTAEGILRKAALDLTRGFDSMRVHERAARELDRLGFMPADMRYYKLKLSKITGVL